MDNVAYQAKIDILEKKLARTEELLKSAREMSDQRGVRLMKIREQLNRLGKEIRIAGIDDTGVLKAVSELNEASR